MRCLLLLCCLVSSGVLIAQQQPFRFAFVTDSHIGSPDGRAEEDLRRTVADINATRDLAFVVITGDVTEMGTDAEILLAKKILDSLRIPWFILPGNHDTGWSESGGVSFTSVFGYDKFVFEHAGVAFIGCASGPYVRMSDGHIPRDAVNWLDSLARVIPDTQPIIYLNHYPTDNSLDNWYEVTDRFRNKNTMVMLCGHGHTNKAMNFEGIPGVMSRSNLRAKAEVGGYNVVSVAPDSIRFVERRPGTDYTKQWTSVSSKRVKDTMTMAFERPSYQVNKTYSQVSKRWQFAAPANIASTPSVNNQFAFVGDLNGTMHALRLSDGRPAWKVQTGGSIFSSPALSGNKVVFGSGDGHVYCLHAKTGQLLWKSKANAAVLGSPLIHDEKVFIGSSDHSFRCFDLNAGKQVWSFDSLKGPVVSTPVMSNGKLIFGAWDTYLYAVDAQNGKLLWKWNNGSQVRNFSPAACVPVVRDGIVYIVAPDRFLTAIDESSGATLWRSNEAKVRESLGISEDGRFVYGKTMQDTIVAFATGKTKEPAAWKMHVGFGYEHSPSMLVEKDAAVFFGTRNGVVYSIDPASRRTLWAHKIDNSMVNTVRPVGKNHLLASTMDGKVVMLKW